MSLKTLACRWSRHETPKRDTQAFVIKGSNENDAVPESAGLAIARTQGNAPDGNTTASIRSILGCFCDAGHICSPKRSCGKTTQSVQHTSQHACHASSEGDCYKPTNCSDSDEFADSGQLIENSFVKVDGPVNHRDAWAFENIRHGFSIVQITSKAPSHSPSSSSSTTWTLQPTSSPSSSPPACLWSCAKYISDVLVCGELPCGKAQELRTAQELCVTIIGLYHVIFTGSAGVQCIPTY